MRVRFSMVFVPVVAGLFMILTLVSQPESVFASVYFHGDFATDAQSCSSCHRVHFAETESLLTHGSNETDFCYYCHGDGSGENSSGYNVQSGEVTVGSKKRPSYAGGFEKSIDPGRSNSEVYPNTSVHNVEVPRSSGGGAQLLEEDILGGGRWQGAFKCSSCHDPHSGGQYPDTPYRNPRLLRKNLLGDTTDRYVYMSIDYGNTNLPLAYGAGFNNWCGGCHDKFNTEGAERTGAQGDGDASMSKFRHKVGVKIPDQVFSTDPGTGLPIAKDNEGQWWLNCMTCHRAHGSSVSVSIGFTRDNSSAQKYNDGENQSTLLRLPERGVCYRCHGSAEYNKYNSDGVDNRYGTGW